MAKMTPEMAFRVDASIIENGEPIDGRIYEITPHEKAAIVLAYMDESSPRIQTSFVGQPDMILAVILECLQIFGEETGGTVQIMTGKACPKQEKRVGRKQAEIDLLRKIREMFNRLDAEKGSNHEGENGEVGLGDE